MPEPANPKLRPTLHGIRATPSTNTVAYAELTVTSNFTFLRGGSHPEEYVEQAARLGHRAIAIADTNTLGGVVRAHVAAKQVGLPLVVGCRLVLVEPADLKVLVYPTDSASYGRLCRLLTLGKRRAGKGECHLILHDLLEHTAGLLAVVVPPRVLDKTFISTVQGLRAAFDDDRLSIAASVRYRQHDADRVRQIVWLSEHVGVPMAATNDVLYHSPQRRPLQDVLTCIRHGCTIEQAGYRLQSNAERHLKPGDEMARLFANYPQAISRSIAIADRAAGFSLDQLRYLYPHEVVPADRTPMQHLAELTWVGAAKRYPQGVSEKVRQQIEHELMLIAELNYPHYFLTVDDIMQFAASRHILCQGRGAAANSAVCYCLGITAVDPERIDVLFERFVSKERDEPPDIDIDFEHERREEVIQYLYAKYGRDRAALTAEIITYRGRSAVREVGKVLGLSLDAVDRLAKQVEGWGHDEVDPAALKALGFDPADVTIQHLVKLSSELHGFPRHRSQHVGGFVLTDKPLCELVPIENAAMADRTVIEWDKDDIDALGMLKVDVLGLGMLTAIRKCFDLVEQHHGRSLTLAEVFQQTPQEDPVVYDMICRADTVGVFQIESRAQIAMLPRLRPRCFYDLVIQVAIVRPGPIQGDMVHPYLRRRDDLEKADYPDAVAGAVLGKTLGVPLFQEQVMALAVRCAGFTPGEADALRRTMAAWKRKGHLIHRFRDKLVHGLLARGYSQSFADRCFEQIKGFGEYGFPESHAASFALLVYVSAWLKHHYPAAFTAALLNSQPMGFYGPSQLVRDAKEHGITVHPIDVSHSQRDCTLEAAICGSVQPALRLGLRMVKGMNHDEADRLITAVAAHGPFTSMESLWRIAGISLPTLRRLAEADAFQSMHLDRQHALWQVMKLRDVPAPLFEQSASSFKPSPGQREGLDHPPDHATNLPPLPPLKRVTADYAATGLSLKQHPLAFLRPWLDGQRVTPAANLADERRYPHGSPVTVAGLVTIRQHPSTAKGVTFITLEDETGHANLTVQRDVFARYRAIARDSMVLLAQGRVERRGQIIHLRTHACHRLDDRLPQLVARSRDFR